MRRALTCTAAALVAAIGPATSALARGRHAAAPSPAAVAKALKLVESSPDLWATVNICTPKPHHGGLVGIRGEMPALGFPATLTMTIQLNQLSARTGSYSPVPGATATNTVAIGTFATRLHQDGAAFPFSADTPRLDATVTFTWSRGSTQLGQVTRTTTGGHPQADFGEPPHHSSATCKL